MNAQAQWQIFNAGNWFSIEDELRNFASRKGKNLVVYTGTHGVMELDDVNGNKAEIHLNLERPGVSRLPVARYVIFLINQKLLSAIITLLILSMHSGLSSQFSARGKINF